MLIGIISTCIFADGVKISDDVIVLSTPGTADENLVFTSQLDFSVVPSPANSGLSSDPAGSGPALRQQQQQRGSLRRGRVRSHQEEIEDLTYLSELAEKVFR